MKAKRILIGADIVPTAKNYDSFVSGDAKTLLGDELKEVFDRADYRIFNLETPFTDVGEPILKTGPNLKVPTATVNGYVAMGIDLLAVANNHTMDQGKEAFAQTLDILTENNISYVGGGRTKEESKRAHIIELDGKKVGVYACCEHEFSWFDDYGIGANGFDPLESLDDIAELREKVDFVIVLYHGGREHFRYPSPYLQKVCRKIADKGANLVLCQHTHCVGAKESYGKATIVYGQGNALFDSATGGQIPCWQTALLVELILSDGEFSINYIPIEKNGACTSLSHDSEIISAFEKRSEEIKKEGFVKENYVRFVMENPDIFKSYLTHLSAGDELGTTHGAGTRNLLNCEPHREFIITYMTELH